MLFRLKVKLTIQTETLVNKVKVKQFIYAIIAKDLIDIHT